MEQTGLEGKGFDNMPVGGFARRYNIGIREIVLGITILVLFVMFAAFAGMYGQSKNSNNAPQQAGQSGSGGNSGHSGNSGNSGHSGGTKVDNTCHSKICLESAAYMLFQMNTSYDPCKNFYQYACGSYAAFRPTNADTSQHTIFTDMYKRNEDKLKTILESPVNRKTDWAAERKLKELFQSCMDDYTLEKLRGTPFINQVIVPLGGWYVLGSWSASSFNLNNMLKKVQSDFWVDAMWAFRVNVDFYDRSKTAIRIYPAGTSRHMYWFYYISPQATKVQNDYKKFIRRVANLLVRDSNVTMDPATQKERVDTFVSDAFTMETNMANLSLTTQWTINPYGESNQITLNDLTRQTGNVIDWTQQATYLFDTSGITGNKKTIVFNLNYLKGLSRMINNLPTGVRARMIHNYLIWRVAEVYVQDLSWEYVHANREMYVDTTGRTEFLGKAKYCFRYVGRAMPEALGALYIGDHFADVNKAKVTEITGTTRTALANLLARTSWMDKKTVAVAEEKIKAATYKLGYPAFLTNTSALDTMFRSVNINASDFFGNVLNINQYDKVSWNKQLKNGEDRSKWYFRTFDTNMALLWYWNEIVVPAGLLQFPLYDFNLPHYFTFGGFGSFLGHFVLHLIDEYGKNWDNDGNYLGYKNEWWTNATMTAYTNIKKCMVNYYNRSMGPFTAPDGSTVQIPIRSSQTAASNIALVSGLKLAYNAYHLWESKKGKEKMAPTGKNYTNEQLFFISFAQTNCYSRDPQTAYRYAKSGRIREDYEVNLAVSQLKEFSEAFQCKPKATLNPTKKCTLY